MKRGAALLMLWVAGAIPLLVWLDADDMFEQPKQLALKIAAASLGIGLALNTAPVAPAALAWPVGLALLAGLASALASPLRLTGFFGEYTSYQGWLHWVTLAGLLWPASLLMRQPGIRRRLLAAVSVSAAIVSVYALVQLAGLDPVAWSVNGPVVRTFSTTGNPLYLGCFLAAALPAVFGVAATAASGIGRWGSLSMAALTLAGLISSGSRSALAAALAGTAVVGWHTRPHLAPRLVHQAMLVGVVALLACGVLFPADRNPFPLLARRFAEVTRGEDGRPQIWLAALRLWRERPLLGSGPDTFATLVPGVQTAALWNQLWHGSPEKAHNDLLQLLATVGVLGTGAILWMGASVFRLARAARDPLAAAAAGGLAAYTITSLFAFGTCSPQVVAVVLAGLLAAGSRLVAVPRPVTGGLALLLVLSLLAHLQFATGEVALKHAVRAGGRGLGAAQALHTPWAQRLLRAGDTLEHAVLGSQLGGPDAAGTTPLREAIDRLYIEAGVLNPLHPFAHSDHGRMLARQGRIDEAMEEYGEARRLAPRDAYLSIECAQILLGAGRDAEARTLLEQVTTTYPAFAEPYGLIGYSWIKHRDWARAIPWLEKSTVLDWHGNDPAGYAAASNLAAAYHRLGREADAARAAAMAQRFMPASPASAP